ncbi:putative nicotinate-nucleotide pyrophosphorylase [carboxylating] [Halomicronema hongdechloris C2206]|uniref:Probable nicotinate-nucleotide pyrophosphorylase [carboxylating] n=1 Tax=Halomicronema hongdechloris C2206 TaxID=1641165 RepID=A0A1Z3HUF6_9CYAN|nr:carboxylating nicotinate-nucleotide diphosphorylase [Halomicronema hongdechloris]ASC73916.1 putative nicotinate-nucleotide pyrophosphorylase [carboxylating] [Halomicronema hongdechloris C2206]
MLPPQFILDPLLQIWLREDIGRGDLSTQALAPVRDEVRQGVWQIKQAGVVVGLPVAARVFEVLDAEVSFMPQVSEGEFWAAGTTIACLQGPLAALLMGERVALNLVMRLSGVATLTRRYADQIADLPTQLVDTRKTTPGLRLLEKYATRMGGAVNHRLGLDDAVMLKDNHIAAAGGIGAVMQRLRQGARGDGPSGRVGDHGIPHPISIEVETETLDQVEEALAWGVDIIMLDNMPLDRMAEAVRRIRQQPAPPLIEASGNITLETIRAVAATGVDYVSTSAPITQAPWLDISMTLQGVGE